MVWGMAVKTKRSRPVPSAPVAALATIPAGPRLSAALAELDLPSLTGFDAVLVVKARNRQGNHERGQLLVTVAEVMRRKDPDYGAHDMESWDEVGSNEIRAALMLTRRAANSLCGLARDLAVRLPTVLAAMTAGHLDQPRARVFSSWTEGLADRHAHALVARLLPIAPKLTTAQLIDALQRGAIDLDPDWARRRYENAITARRVIGVLSHDGTANLTGENLPADQVAAACDRLDAMARYLKRHGHPDRIDHIRTDIYLGLLDGSYSGLTETQLLDHLVATMPPPPNPTTPGDQPADPDPSPNPDDHATEPDASAADDTEPGAAEPGAAEANAADADAGRRQTGAKPARQSQTRAGTAIDAVNRDPTPPPSPLWMISPARTVTPPSPGRTETPLPPRRRPRTPPPPTGSAFGVGDCACWWGWARSPVATAAVATSSATARYTPNSPAASAPPRARPGSTCSPTPTAHQ